TAAVAIAAIVLPEMLLRKLVVPSGCTKDIRNFVALLYFSLFDNSIEIFTYNFLAFFRHVINCQDLAILDKRSTSCGLAENVVDVEAQFLITIMEGTHFNQPPPLLFLSRKKFVSFILTITLTDRF